MENYKTINYKERIVCLHDPNDMYIKGGSKTNIKAEEKRKANLQPVIENFKYPKVEITHQQHPFSTIKFTLSGNDNIIAQKNAFMYKNQNATFRSKFKSGLKKVFGRLFAGETLLLNEYYRKENTDSPGEVCFNSPLPGEICTMDINPGESFYLDNKTFIATTHNLKVSAKTQFTGLLNEGNLFYTSFINESNKVGTVWFQPFGAIQKIKLAQHEKLHIDNGYMLGYDKKLNITLKKVSNMFGFFFGGVGLVMEVKPKDDQKFAEFYLQTRNFRKYQNIIAPPWKFSSNTYQSSVEISE